MQFFIERYIFNEHSNCIFCNKHFNKFSNTHELFCDKNPNKKEGRKLTAEEKKNLSIIAKARKFGGYRKNSGRGIKGYYKNIWCDSSWELAFLLYCLDKGLNIKRSKKSLEYQFEGETHHYHPDFEIDEYLIEIKGFYDEKSLVKRKFFPNIIYIDKNNINKYLSYAKATYGRHFYNLLENSSEYKNKKKKEKIEKERESQLTSVVSNKKISKKPEISVEEKSIKRKEFEEKRRKTLLDINDKQREINEINFKKDLQKILCYDRNKYGWIHKASIELNMKKSRIVRVCKHYNIEYRTLFDNRPIKNPSKDKIWITNGKETILISQQHEIPDGWRRGRTLKH